VNVTSRLRSRRAAAAGALVVLATLMGSTASVGAAEGDHPQVTHDPAISGWPYVGETLTAINGAYTPSDANATYYWFRCTQTDEFDCKPIATGVSYRLAEADLGKYMRVLLYVCKGGRDNCDGAWSEVGGPVSRRAAPTPTPTATPTPPPPPPPAPVIAPASPSGGVLGDKSSSLRWLAPFPIVRIKGWLTSSGAMVTMLTVRAPRGSTITMRCRGRNCPRKRYARATMLVHLHPYERLLRGAMRLEISVTRRGFVGKRTVINLRGGKAPTRRDLCLYPGARRAKSCKAAV
jgi:hypothetical protein